jgi:hypothetical protein
LENNGILPTGVDKLLAQINEQAYQEETDRKTVILGLKYMSRKSTEFFVTYEDDKNIVLSIRGIKSVLIEGLIGVIGFQSGKLRTLIFNTVGAILPEVPLYANVFWGLLLAVQHFITLNQLQKDNPNGVHKNMIITGHSFGGLIVMELYRHIEQSILRDKFFPDEPEEEFRVIDTQGTDADATERDMLDSIKFDEETKNLLTDEEMEVFRQDNQLEETFVTFNALYPQRNERDWGLNFIRKHWVNNDPISNPIRNDKSRRSLKYEGFANPLNSHSLKFFTVQPLIDLIARVELGDRLN